MSLANNVDFLRRLQKLDRFNRFPELGLRPDIESPLVEVRDFGPNPGGLRMFKFVPEALQQPRALVVVLHGCGQTAANYDLGAQQPDQRMREIFHGVADSSAGTRAL